MSGNLGAESVRRLRNGNYVFAVHGRGMRSSGRPHGSRHRGRRAYTFDHPAQFSLAALSTPENLMIAWKALRSGGGTAPGPDGRTFDDYSRREAFALLRTTSRDLRAGTYRPGPTRLCRSPKGDGRFRELQLENIIDRVVAKTLQRAIAPYVERVAPHLRRSPWMIFAQMERIVRDRGFFPLVTDDIRDFFPSVRIEDVLDAHRPHLTQPDLFRLFETLVRGHEGPDRVVGLDQGSPLSPAAAELSLHHHLDLLQDAYGRAHPSLRYVDNLTYLHSDAQAGHETLRRVREVLAPHGLNFKGTDGTPVDLRERGHKHAVLGMVPNSRRSPG